MKQPPRPAPVSGAAGTFSFDRPLYLRAAVLVVLLAALHVWLIARIDNTNLGTTNGLWKCTDVRAWELGTSHPGDSGGLLYMATYGLLARVIPDAAVSYGARPAVLTLRKMAMINGVFGALATGAVFVLAFRLLGSASLALAVAFAHLGSGFVLLNSLNSEDVIPAYAFFTLAVTAYMRHVLTHRLIPLVLAAFLVALVTLFHWTLMPPALAAFGITELALVLRRKAPAVGLLVFPLCFLGAIALFVAGAHLYNPASPIAFLDILFPAKVRPSGWLGFSQIKVIYALMGMGNYFSGARNVVDYREALDYPHWLRPMIVSWAYLAMTFSACLLSLLRRQIDHGLRVIGGFGLALFIIGQAEHLYSQPQDPQSQIQPMFVTVAGLIVLLGLLRKRVAVARLRPAGLGLAAAFLLNGAVHVAGFLEDRGADSRAVADARALAGTLRSRRAVLVSNGMEAWNAWLLLEAYRGDRREYLAGNIHLFSVFVDRPGISGREAARLMKQRIDTAFRRGQAVLAADLWTRPRQDFAQAMTTLVDTGTALAFDDALRAAFRAGRVLESAVGPLVELLPEGAR